MQRVRLPFPEDKTAALFAVGFEPLVLRGYYDPSQLWLSFVQAVVAYPVRQSKETDTKEPRWWEERRRAQDQKKRTKVACGAELTAKWNAEQRILLEGDVRRMFIYEKGLEQYTLPFAEYRHISQKEKKRLDEAGWPGFDRTEEGKLYSVSLVNDTVAPKRDRRDTLREWCAENCYGRYFISTSQAVFERMQDAIAAKLYL